ncbi:MAG: hypothetical protein WDW38_008100 [Sanguina aurantia]
MKEDALAPVLAALHPLSSPPSAPGWNHADMTTFLGTTRRHGAMAALVCTTTDATDPAIGRWLAGLGLGRPDATGTLDPSRVTPLGFLDGSFSSAGRHAILQDTVVTMQAAADAQLHAAPDEVAEVFEVPLAFLLEPANLRRYTMEFRGQRRPMVEFVHGGHRIWGATASMLLNLLQRMGVAHA